MQGRWGRHRVIEERGVVRAVVRSWPEIGCKVREGVVGREDGLFVVP